MYADDISIWALTSRDDAEQLKTLQQGLDIIDAFLTLTGMKPSPEKTKYLVFGVGWDRARANLKLNGKNTDKTEEHTILGMHLNSNLDTKTWLQRMSST